MERRLSGLAASTGLAFGPAVMFRAVGEMRREKGPVASERQALADAISASLEAVAALAESLNGEAADIVGFQVALLDDDALTEAAYAAIEGGAAADTAWRQAMVDEIAGYEASDDPYFRARAADIADIRDRVLRQLFDLPELTSAPPGAIILAQDLPPSAFLGIDWSRGGGIVLGAGSPTSHVAMLARGRSVPMVVGIGSEWEAISGTVVVDGVAGLVLTGASHESIERARRQANDLGRLREQAEARKSQPAVTRDGTPIAVMINVADLDDVAGLPPEACDGIGLTRTEFLVEQTLRDEMAQFEAYAGLLRWAAGRPVTIRTLDAGGDKPIAGYTLDGETNPFLGLRGIRLSLRHPDIFRVQLRALARAAAIGPLKIMLPMVTTAQELEQARALLDAVLVDLAAEDMPHAVPALGIMVEVPAAAMAIASFDAAFFSIGSNDLTQYATAAARDGLAVAAYSDVLHPGVLAMISHVARHGAETGREVSLCGDAGGDPHAIEALLRAGIRVVSVSPGLLAIAKDAIRDVDLSVPDEAA
ncbi:phosphoenolpyruvate--protein phosphotransferase [Bosea sp. Tri-44]|uniref:phosphoenolpyruvate--protein phosphotransferase n=1 Tax=Bosea sp. Tri-44 TaxID=1972137 RepID=UPI00100F1473|nr:putative PEP-binding protein [Bosea sp. Tri-44]RXT57080.1 phosphoenolpyruvate--protein phosphotransferase [Bosea sp. Tri-44]